MNACNKLYASPINSYWYITLKTRNSSMVGQEKKSRKSIGCLIWKAWMCQSIQYILRYPTENFDKLVVQDEKSWEGSRVGFSSGEHECWMTADVSLQYLSLFNLKWPKITGIFWDIIWDTCMAWTLWHWSIQTWWVRYTVFDKEAVISVHSLYTLSHNGHSILDQY